MGRLRYPASTRAKLLIAIAAGSLITAPVAVFASHQFSDVDSNHPFHKEIGVVADAGIAQGFNDGTYRPGNNVTRQAMAAFLERAVGRVGFDSSATADIGAGGLLARSAVVAEVGVKAGAAGEESNGFIVLLGSARAASGSPGSCPCRVYLELMVNGELITDTSTDVPSAADESGQARTIASISAVVPIAGDESASYQLVARTDDSNVSSMLVGGELTALYVPLGPDGDDTVDYEHGCTGAETEPNDYFEEANPVASGACTVGHVGPDDYDFYSIEVPAGHDLTVEVESVDGSGCGGDSKIQIVDEFYTVLAEDDNSGVGSCARIFRTGGPSTGTGVQWRVFAADQERTFDYSMTATLSATP